MRIAPEIVLTDEERGELTRLAELSKLHEEQPEQVSAMASGETAITRTAVAALKSEGPKLPVPGRPLAGPRRGTSLIGQANDCCSKLESLLARMSEPEAATVDELAALSRRLADLANR